MARRKSPWQQFADNFDSTYGTFNTMFSDIEEGRIMREEPETMYGADLGGIGSPHAAPTKWKYGGQTYDKQITPEQLTGLRNQRLIDNMAKWGDTKGAMEMQNLQADIESKTAGTENIQQRTNLLVAQFPDLAMKIGYDNLATQAGTSLNLTKKEDILRRLKPFERYAAAQLVNLKWDNKYLTETFDSRVKIKGEEADQAAIKTEVAEVERDISVALKPTDITAGIAKNLASVSTSELSQVQDDAAMGPLKEKIAVNDMMEKFRDRAALAPHLGGFADDQAAQDWLVKQLSTINPTLSLDLKKNYNSHQIAAITQQSTMFKTAAMEAYTSGGVRGLSEAIDNLNGVDNTRIEEDTEANSVTIWAVDAKTNKDLRVIVSGTLGEGGDFEMNLQKALDPASAMAISKSYHDDLNTQADTLYKAAMAKKAEQEGLAASKVQKEFDKNDFFIRMLIEDPGNQLAWHGLLGADMSADEIRVAVMAEQLRAADDEAAEGVGGSGYSDGLESEDGPVAKTKDDKERYVEYVSVAGTTGVTKIQVDKSGTLNEQKAQIKAAKKEINDRTWVVYRILEDDIIPWTLDRNLKAKDLAAQQLRDTAKTWLQNHFQYFGAHPDQLAALEANPEKWVADNITAKGLSGG